jgi:pimeloyl-ACP methyl ester carboxylesterase
MFSYVSSADGTRIAYERFGDGPPIVIVGGLFCDRQSFRPLAEQLAPRFTAVTYDRRGRGDSGDTRPYAAEREVEDLGAVIAAVGGEASVYGHSSGAGLALEAAAAGLPITSLVLHEPPYGGDDDESQREARDLAETVRVAVAEDRRGDAIKAFLTASGMPPEMADGAASDPKMIAIARTMPYDFEVMGDREGGTIPEERVRALRMPTLVNPRRGEPGLLRRNGQSDRRAPPGRKAHRARGPGSRCAGGGRRSGRRRVRRQRRSDGMMVVASGRAPVGGNDGDVRARPGRRRRPVGVA